MATNDPRALLKRLLAERAESEWLEFKHNNCDPDEIGRCVSACANASMLAEKDRAYIIWGIENVTKRKVGTTFSLSTTKKGNENFSNWLSRMMSPQLVMEFLDFEDGSLQFSILVIDPAYNRPVRFSGTEYIRIGENIKKLQEYPEHERTLWLATGRRRFENAIALPHQTVKSIFDKTDFDTYYKLSGNPKPVRKAEQIRRFLNLEFIKEDGEGNYDITNLGALLFATDLTNFSSVSGKSVRVIQYSGPDKRVSVGEIEGRKGYAIGFSGLLNYILRALPREEKFSSGVRHSESRYSEIAIREVIANALIHQDFTITGAGPVVEIYSDRVEVINPGNSLIETDRIIDERRSRNEKLAQRMRDLGICEERGGGIDKAIIDVEERFLPAPEFYASRDSMRVVIFGPKKFTELSKEDKIWSFFCHCVVKWIRRNPMNNTTLRERFSLAPEEYQIVSEVISNARKAGRIILADPNQGKKNARYVPYWVK